jgi:chemotaxis protein CheD
MSKMNDKLYISNCEKYHLNPGYIYISGTPTIISTVLGSCVAICMHDRVINYGGMNHYLLPKKGKNDQPTARYGDVSIMKLYKTFLEFGSNPVNLTAHIIGGAYLENSRDSKAIADENVEISRVFLNNLRIKIISEDTGGTMGRKLIYFTEFNEIFVAKLQKIRTTDFYKK